MNKLYIDKWFKLPPKENCRNYTVEIKMQPKGEGKRRAKRGKPCKKNV